MHAITLALDGICGTLHCLYLLSIRGVPYACMRCTHNSGEPGQVKFFAGIETPRVRCPLILPVKDVIIGTAANVLPSLGSCHAVTQLGRGAYTFTTLICFVVRVCYICGWTKQGRPQIRLGEPV
jgi:hypothetical protein